MSLYNLHYLEFMATSHDKFLSHPGFQAYPGFLRHTEKPPSEVSTNVPTKGLKLTP